MGKIATLDKCCQFKTNSTWRVFKVSKFGRHSCKMFIRGKPIRFGFKNWVLAADDGYPFKVVPYQGKEQGAVSGLLGPRVVNSLLEVVKHPAKHEVYFDNFFTSFPCSSISESMA